MKVLSISDLDIWRLGEGKGIPSVFASQYAFVKKGYEVHFICPLSKEGLTQKENYEGIHIFRFRMPFNLSTLKALSISRKRLTDRIYAAIYYNLEWLFFQIFGLCWLLKYTSQIKPHLIYVHTITPAFFSYLVSRIYHIKLVIRVYGTRDLYRKRDSFWYRTKELRDYLSLKIPADYFIITDDGSNAHLLIKQLGVPADKIRNWRNGVDFSIYDPSPENRKEISKTLNIKTVTKILISTSRITRDYGVDVLVESLPVFFRENAETVCVIFGEGSDKKKLEEYVSKNNIQDKVFFLGLLRHDILNRFLNASDIFVFLSRINNCTNTMWEAMVCGKCIVTTDNQNIREILTSGKNAVLVPGDGFGKLPEILNNLLLDDELRNRLGNNARLRAKEILETWPERMGKEIDLLEALVKT